MFDLTKVFKHLSRDIFIYFFPGFVVLFNIFLIDYVFNSFKLFSYLSKFSISIFVSFVFSFLVGHLVFGLIYFLFELTRLEKYFRCKFNFITVSTLDDINTFNNFPDLHEQYIERHSQLYLMRWNLSGSIMLCSVFNLLHFAFFDFSILFFIISITTLILGFFLYVLSLKTENDCAEYINLINNLNKDKN